MYSSSISATHLMKKRKSWEIFNLKQKKKSTALTENATHLTLPQTPLLTPSTTTTTTKPSPIPHYTTDNTHSISHPHHPSLFLANRVKKPDEFNRPRIPIPQRKVKRKNVYLTKKVSHHPTHLHPFPTHTLNLHARVMHSDALFAVSRLTRVCGSDVVGIAID